MYAIGKAIGVLLLKNSAFRSGVEESYFFTYVIKIEILHCAMCNVQYKGTDIIFECHCTKSSFDMTLWHFLK